ncbi:RNA-guided endonuclease IscB [Coleofasciculus sp.]|uniref:RNA-guided endonuclease IscB n=1 Tax=Coleofasciculus sp. TaxID=3100458 RepID=UPI0039FAAA60
MFVFVLDKNRKPLDPTHPARARRLLVSGRASVFRRYPLTIILHDRLKENSQTQLFRLKIDPGAKTTGLAILQGSVVVWAAELSHRGFAIRDALTTRRQLRRSRRNRKTRYRAARFDNRRRQSGWLPPSLNSRVENTLTWVRRLIKFCPITAISQELVKFDLSKMQNPEISGVMYQQGSLAGYEVREYLLTKFARRCVYCGATDTRLEVEHVVPRSLGGSNRVSNLTLACHPCNQSKGNQDIKDFLSGKPDVLKRVLAQIKKPLVDAAAVNTTRWALFERLKATGLPVETGTGGQTKFNRTRLGLDKTHYGDAVAVGSSTPEQVIVKVNKPLMIKATGYGHRRMCNITKFGFPQVNKKGELAVRKRVKVVHGFQTGDMVRAVVRSGKNVGTHVGRVTVRATGQFDISTAKSKLQIINHKYCQPIHRQDGYSYAEFSTFVHRITD